MYICDLCSDPVEDSEKGSHTCKLTLETAKAPIRKFETGASRDTDLGKLDYEGFLSPLVVVRYAEYMDKHRKQADGSIRGSDNWQSHFGGEHFSVCMKSLFRHFIDLWMEHRGFPSRDGIEDALMGVLFNTIAYADKYLKDQRERELARPAL